MANRIQRIRPSTKPEQWRHVSSENNPADCASRGLSAVQIRESNWLKGPNWQRTPQSLQVDDIVILQNDSADGKVRKVTLLLSDTPAQ